MWRVEILVRGFEAEAGVAALQSVQACGKAGFSVNEAALGLRVSRSASEEVAALVGHTWQGGCPAPRRTVKWPALLPGASNLQTAIDDAFQLAIKVRRVLVIARRVANDQVVLAGARNGSARASSSISLLAGARS